MSIFVGRTLEGDTETSGYLDRSIRDLLNETRCLRERIRAKAGFRPFGAVTGGWSRWQNSLPSR